MSQRAYLGDGHYARGNIFNALQYEGDSRSLIENVVGGAGNDRLTGNSAANTLKGGAGKDVLESSQKFQMPLRDLMLYGPQK
ncbi:MAG: hypothetical protein ACJ74G_17980 [Blastocatellia bacterium]